MHTNQGSNGRNRPSVSTLVTSASGDRSQGPTRDPTLVSPRWSEEPEEKIGGRVGRYLLRRELGVGGMGIVYEGYDPDLERPVAVKLLHVAFDSERLAREARALAKVSHPNVVAVYDVGTFGARAFIAMELVDGTTLRRWIAEQQRSLEDVLDVAMQAGRGLAAAHAVGLLHRDFKPDNVMVGRDGRVRVLDFGIVRPFDEATVVAPSDAEEPRSSRAFNLVDGHWGTSSGGALVGTPAYMAPEQVRARTMTPAADQFSFCVALWELVYGERPFAPDVLLERMRGADAVAPKAPPDRSAVPNWLRRVLERGLAFESISRYPSMLSLLDALEAGLKREATERRLLGRRYEILKATLGTALPGTEGAFDRITGRLVTIKRWPSRELGACPSRDELSRIFKQRASLRHPNLVELLDFGRDHADAPYWVLDLKDRGIDVISAARRSGTSSLVDYFRQLLHALRYLHKHGVYLGALGPATVLVVKDQLKLVPIGPSLPQVDAQCVAPEVTQGAAPSVAADLYAFGAFALQCMSACAGDPAEPHSQMENGADIGEQSAMVFRRLVTSDPSARCQSVDEVVRALDGAGGRAQSIETLEVRESHLRAAPFLGRDEELAMLEDAVRGACRGHGAAWLLSGESGVGKSRLLEEVASLSVVHGGLVLRGHEEREGGSPYRLFRDVLRGLALLTDLDEIEASVLLAVVPNLEEIVGRAVSPPPESDGLSSHARLVEVVKGLLLRQEQPIVMLLEDIQWSRSDSIDLLQQLGAAVGSTPILIVATARDDALLLAGDSLGSLRRLQLGRLQRSTMARLAEVMIGQAGKRPALLDLLQRETEGNAFFLVEVVRTLAEAAGGLERIGEAALPEKVFAEGVQSLVQQRLRRISGQARALLQVAAVVGRRLEPKLLTRVVPEADFELCVRKCVDAAILEESDDGLRFCHDKLREGVLASLPDAERATLHARVAEAMEVEYEGQPQFYAALADHFRQGSNPAKEAHYAGLAGNYALVYGALREASELLERAHAWWEKQEDSLALGRICVALSDAYHLRIEMALALAYAARAGRAVGYPFASGKYTRIAALIWQLLLHVLYRVWPRLARRRDAAQREACDVASLAAGSCGYISISEASRVGVLYFSLKAWNLAQSAERPNAWASGVVGYGLLTLGFARLARSYFASSGRGTVHADSYGNIKISFFLGVGELDAAEALIREGFEIQPLTGVDRNEAVRWFYLGHCALLRGEVAEAEHCFVLATADEGTRANFWPALAFVRCFTGRFREAEPLLEESLRDTNPPAPRAMGFAVLALIRALRNDIPGALSAADRAVALAAGESTFGFAGNVYFAGVFEAYLAALEHAQSDEAPIGPALRRLRRVARHCRSWARAFWVGRPLSFLYEGKLAELLGRPDRAQRLWLRSREVARGIGLELYVTLATRELEAMSSEAAAARRGRANSPI